MNLLKKVHTHYATKICLGHLWGQVDSRNALLSLPKMVVSAICRTISLMTAFSAVSAILLCKPAAVKIIFAVFQIIMV